MCKNQGKGKLCLVFFVFSRKYHKIFQIQISLWTLVPIHKWFGGHFSCSVRLLLFYSLVTFYCFTTDLARLQRTQPPAGTVYPPSHAERLCWEPTGGAWNQRRAWDSAHTKWHTTFLYVHICLDFAHSLSKAHMDCNRFARPLAFTVRFEILMVGRCCEQWSRNSDQQAATSAASPCAQTITKSQWPEATWVLQQLWSTWMAEQC